MIEDKYPSQSWAQIFTDGSPTEAGGAGGTHETSQWI